MTKKTIVLPQPQPLIKVVQKLPEYHCKDFIPILKYTTTFLSAQGGSGKSFLALQLAIRLVNSNEDANVLLWLSEDEAGFTKYRAEEVINKIKGTGKKLEHIDIIDEMPSYLTTDSYEAYLNLFSPYDLIILDPLIAFYGQEENNNTQARLFMNLLNKIARKNTQGILIIHHSTKPTRDQESHSRGAGAFIDAARLAYELKNTETKEEKEIIVAKDNSGVRRLIGDSKIIQVLPYLEEEYEEEEEEDFSQYDSEALGITFVDDRPKTTKEETAKIKEMKENGFEFDD